MQRLLVAALIGALGTAMAQVRVETRTKAGETRTIVGGGAGEPVFIAEGGANVGFAFAPQAATFQFMSADMGFGGKVVKGAPYSAEGVTEFTQTLGDGTKIQRKTSSKFARDIEGRTRQEQSLGTIGPWAGNADAPTLVSINDPVSGEAYTLNDKDKTAIKMLVVRAKSPNGESMSESHVIAWKAASARGGTSEVHVERDFNIEVAPGSAGAAGAAGVRAAGVAGASGVFTHAIPATPRMFNLAGKGTPESLGNQTIEGVVCEGTRFTTTIPAGSIGNDRPIISTEERWYSQELQTVVMTKSNDPTAGETVYRLTKIQRSEPDRSLFQVPAGYTVEDASDIKLKVDRLKMNK